MKIRLIFVLVSVHVLTAFVHGQQLATTPPLGWDSWPNYGTSFKEAEVKFYTDYITKKSYAIRVGIYLSGYGVVPRPFNHTKYSRGTVVVQKGPILNNTLTHMAA